MIIFSLRYNGKQILLFYSISVLGVSYTIKGQTENSSLGLLFILLLFFFGDQVGKMQQKPVYAEAQQLVNQVIFQQNIPSVLKCITHHTGVLERHSALPACSHSCNPQLSLPLHAQTLTHTDMFNCCITKAITRNRSDCHAPKKGFLKYIANVFYVHAYTHTSWVHS